MGFGLLFINLGSAGTPVGMAPDWLSASVALNTSAMYAGQALGAFGGAWLIANQRKDWLHWGGLGGLLLAMLASTWATNLMNKPLR
jgi:predicted MFS family arabinose efflux permease